MGRRGDGDQEGRLAVGVAVIIKRVDGRHDVLVGRRGVVLCHRGIVDVTHRNGNGCRIMQATGIADSVSEDIRAAEAQGGRVNHHAAGGGGDTVGRLADCGNGQRTSGGMTVVVEHIEDIPTAVLQHGKIVVLGQVDV